MENVRNRENIKYRIHHIDTGPKTNQPIRTQHPNVIRFETFLVNSIQKNSIT